MWDKIKKWFRDDTRYVVHCLCKYAKKNAKYSYAAEGAAYVRFMFEGEYDVSIFTRKGGYIVEVKDRTEKELFNIYPMVLEYNDKRYFKEFVKFLDKLEEGV